MLTLDSEHRYHWSGENPGYKPGVSEVLQAVGVRNTRGNWNPIISDFCHDEIAREFGTAFHAVAKMRGDGVPCEYDPQMEPWIEQYRRFIDSMVGSTMLLNEQPLYSHRYGFAGMPDRVWMQNRTILIHDWKTSETRSNAWRPQLAGYRQLVIERFGLNVNARVPAYTVRFLSDRYIIDPVQDIAGAWIMFKSALNLYKQFQRKEINDGEKKRHD